MFFKREAFADVFASFTFQMPIYALTVASSGAGLENVIAACLGQIGALVVMGCPFGIWIQICRHWFVPGFFILSIVICAYSYSK